MRAYKRHLLCLRHPMLFLLHYHHISEISVLINLLTSEKLSVYFMYLHRANPARAVYTGIFLVTLLCIG